MANRPVFVCMNQSPFFEEVNVDFEFFPGFALIQNRKSILSLHENFSRQHPDDPILEISSKSEDELGVKLSAFNLILNKGDQCFSVECAYQSSKVFQNGGPYSDLLWKSSREAKKDERLKNSGDLIGFNYFNEPFRFEPRTFFYDWLYINALNRYKELHDGLLKYNAFTDIVFSPRRGKSCQARSAAIFVSLSRNGMLAEALQSKEAFVELVYYGGKYQ